MSAFEIPAWGGPDEIEYLEMTHSDGGPYDFTAGELLSVPVQIPAVSYFNSGPASPGTLNINAWLLYRVDERGERCDFEAVVLEEPKAATQVNSWRPGPGR